MPSNTITDLQRRGFACFPVRKNHKAPISPNGCKDATTSPEQYAALVQGEDETNVGIEASRSGLVLIDVDAKGERNGLDYFKGREPITLTAVTPNGGNHYYFLAPNVQLPNSKDRLYSGVEVKANNQYLVAPPSTIDGKPYRWCNDIEPQPLPDWLLKDILATATPKPSPKPEATQPKKVLTSPDLPYKRAIAYAYKVGGVSGGGRNDAAFKLSGKLRTITDITEMEVMDVMEEWNTWNSPPLDYAELLQATRTNRSTHASPIEDRPLPERRVIDDGGEWPADPAKVGAVPVTAPKVTETKERKPKYYPSVNADVLIADDSVVQKEILIEGLLRRCEVMNLVAAPKARKSWMLADLATSIANGLPWLGRDCTKVKVLLIDNELDIGTIKERLRVICEAKGITAGPNLNVISVRGKEFTIDDLPHTLAIEKPDVVILDALYRFYPQGFVENDNGAMTNLYSRIIGIVTAANCATIMVHHASKGIQNGKSVTDVGAGGGAQSRAADTHATLRPIDSKADTAMALQAHFDTITRSFPPTPQTLLEWKFPLWTPDDTSSYVAPAGLSTEEFVNRFYTSRWQTATDVLNAAKAGGMKQTKFYEYKAKAETMKLIEKDPDGNVIMWRKVEDKPF